MKLPDLLESERSWDRYKAFHWGISIADTVTSTSNNYTSHPFIAFDTKELIFAHHSAGPEARRTYPSLNVQVVGTIDAKLPALALPDDLMTTIPRAWLTDGGSQDLLIDFDTRYVVAINGDLTGSHIPVRLRSSARVYFPGPGEPPVGAPVMVSRPLNKALTKEQLEHVSTLNDALQMEIALTGNKPTIPPLPGTTNWSETNAHRAKWNARPDYDALLDVRVSADLKPIQRYQLFKHGISRHIARVPYLVLV